MSDDAAATMKARLRADLRTAMKERDRTAANVIRALLAALDNAEAPPAPEGSTPEGARAGSTEVQRLALSDARVLQVLQAEVQERERDAEEFERRGRTDRAEDLRAEALIAQRYTQ